MMMFKRFFLIWTWIFPLCLYADISVSPVVVDLIGENTDTEIAVKNMDTTHNAYVEITPYHLVHPDNPQTPKKRIANPEKDGLIVFPAKLALLPGQTQFVRVVKTAKAVTSDQVYEIDFIPKVSTHLVKKANSDGLALGIRVIVGYGARVILRPDVPTPSLSIQRIKNKLTIKNTGNTTLNITSCTQHISRKKAELSLPAYTLFPGQTITKELIRPSRVILDAAFMGKPLGSFYTD